jgi:hypothetical protein
MPDDQTLNVLCDHLLRQFRPDRFVVSGEEEITDEDVITNSWLDEVAAELEREIRVEDLQRVVNRQLRRLVATREGIACKRVNAMLRDYHDRPTLHDPRDPEWIGPLLDDPISVVTRSNLDGRTKILYEHVALRAASSDDLRRFAIEERRRAARDFASRESSCAGAEELADDMDAARVALAGEYLAP